MEKLAKGWTLKVLGLVALPLAFACSTSSEGEEGGLDAALGQQMAELGALGDKFVDQNEEAYDGVAHAAEFIATAFQTPSASAALRSKGGGQIGCFPEGIAGTTFEFNVPSSTFVSTDIPGGPADGVRFLIYEIVDGTATETQIGHVDVTCTGALTGSLNVNVTVTTVDGVELLNLLASNATAFPPADFNAVLSGILRSADGQDEIPFGAAFSGGFISVSEFSGSEQIDFDIGEGVIALVTHSLSVDPGFGTFEQVTIDVSRRLFDAFDPNDFTESACPGFGFTYRADNIQGMGGSLSGDAVFCAPPPLADGFNYFVNCFEGTVDNMTVSAADRSCVTSASALDPTPLPQGVLDDIQAGTDGLFGMFNTVIAVARAAGTVGLEIANSQQQQAF